ncbi:hypothetical protein E3N88_12332 [Mikania micrantha]|uniref:Uncharacterized protein n=1 Tax=Mikania micrantha TaxID=192012 RepID=A0A5N6P781_9ASTR|nr:hypothetical protein E3N88_12332 [Mikania micrantha]
MPPRRQPRRNTRHTNHSHANTDSNETPVDPNMVSAIHQAFEGLLPNFVAQTVEAVQNQNRNEGRGNTNRRIETNVNNTTEGIHSFNNRSQKPTLALLSAVFLISGTKTVPRRERNTTVNPPPSPSFACLRCLTPSFEHQDHNKLR